MNDASVRNLGCLDQTRGNLVIVVCVKKIAHFVSAPSYTIPTDHLCFTVATLTVARQDLFNSARSDGIKI